MVGDSRAPGYSKLVLSNSVADPVIAHIHGLAAFLFDSVVGDAMSSAIVHDKFSWRLFVIECLEYHP